MEGRLIMIKKVTISKMKLEDYDEVYALWESTPGVGMRSLDDSREGIDKYLKRNPDTCFIATNKEKVIGVILCGHDGRRGYIYHTLVTEEYRNNGIAKKLIDAALQALREEGIHKVALVAYADNNLGNEFWENMEFEVRGDLVYRNKSLNDKNL
jgi:ribosomal protein S18 acetylase RimI-like enzyme